jgi:hypothetical protein
MKEEMPCTTIPSELVSDDQGGGMIPRRTREVQRRRTRKRRVSYINIEPTNQTGMEDQGIKVHYTATRGTTRVTTLV